jgi:hypothetical protein
VTRRARDALCHRLPDSPFASDIAGRCLGFRSTVPDLQFLAPIEGVFSVRAGHAAVALRQARVEFCNARGGQAFFHFYLFSPPNDPVPLNWVLSHHIAYAVWEQGIEAFPFNKGELTKLQKSLWAKAEGTRVPAAAGRSDR